MAVFCISSAAMGIWWYPRTKSKTEKTVAPWVTSAKEWMCGRGYRSSKVATFNFR